MDMILLLLWMSCQLLSVTAAPDSFHTTPPPFATSFSCAGRRMGFYVDVETKCRGYHTCDDHGNHFSHYCPEGTAFRQDAMVCDHSHLVNCQANADGDSQQTKIGQDNNHDTPPLSFVASHGKGTHADGFVRSFRINPDSKSSGSTKHHTFELNSSVFLKNRDPSKQQPATTGSRVPDNEYSMTKIEQKDFSQNPFLAPHAATTTSSEESVSRVTVSPLSRELQPPIETSTTSKKSSEAKKDYYSFLIPPPVRDDNVHFSNKPFAKVDNLKNRNSQLSVSSFESFNVDSSDSFAKDSFETVTFSPRTKMIFEMMKARSLGDTADLSFSEPSKLLLPPLIKTDASAHARSNFNFHNDDYPYVETLRSIQNNIVTTPTTPSSLRIHVTEASIFAVPTKALASAKELEKDPYYPKPPTSTEVYYTSQLQSDKSRKPQFTTTRRPFTSHAKFEIPAVLPDLNSLEDLLDRRKFFFIPQVKT